MVKLGGKLKSRRSLILLGGRHEILPCINSLDERDLLDAIKNSMHFLNI